MSSAVLNNYAPEENDRIATAIFSPSTGARRVDRGVSQSAQGRQPLSEPALESRGCSLGAAFILFSVQEDIN